MYIATRLTAYGDPAETLRQALESPRVTVDGQLYLDIILKVTPYISLH